MHIVPHPLIPARRGRGGFTLIEVLAAIVILMLITVFVGRMFADASRIWKLGYRRVNNALDGRAVVDFMVREMSAAIADNVLVFAHRVDADPNILGMASDRIYFCSSDQIAERVNSTDVKRQVRQVSYLVANMRDSANQAMPNRFHILRNIRNNVVGTGGEFQCYTNRNWWQTAAMNYNSTPNSSAAVLAENIRTMEFWIYDQNGVLRAGQDYRSDVHGPPAWVEIYIEMLGEDDAIKAALLTGAAQADFADRASRRYVGRVYFPNGRGYAPAP